MIVTLLQLRTYLFGWSHPGSNQVSPNGQTKRPKSPSNEGDLPVRFVFK